MRNILLSMAYEQSVTMGFNRITRVDVDEWIVNGETLDLEFALYALT